MPGLQPGGSDHPAGHRAAAAGAPSRHDRPGGCHRSRSRDRAVLLRGETMTDTEQAMPRVLLLVPARTYRAADFLLAACRMGLDLVVGSNGALPLGGWPPAPRRGPVPGVHLRRPPACRFLNPSTQTHLSEPRIPGGGVRALLSAAALPRCWVPGGRVGAAVDQRWARHQVGPARSGQDASEGDGSTYPGVATTSCCSAGWRTRWPAAHSLTRSWAGATADGHRRCRPLCLERLEHRQYRDPLR